MFRSPARPQPAYGLLTSDLSHLAFDGAAWKHFQVWARRVGELSTSPKGLSSDTTDRLAALRRLVAVNGQEATWQTRVVEFIRLLISDVESIRELQPSVLSAENGEATADVHQTLRALGATAQRIRQRCPPFSAFVQDFQDKVLFASRQVSAAHDIEAQRLRELQEDVGGLRFEVTSLERQIGELGVLRRGKKKDLETRLAGRRAASTQSGQRAEVLRDALAHLDPLVEGRAWLPQALGDLLSFVDSLQRLCTDFGSAMTQLAVDGTDAQLQDADWLRESLDVAGEVYPWPGLMSAARGFVAESSPSFHPPSKPEVIAS